MFENCKSIPEPFRQREQIEKECPSPHLLTDLVLSEEPWRTFGRETITGAYRDSLNNAHYDGPKLVLSYHLFSVDGEPRTVKFGLKQPGYTCKQARQIIRRGGEIEHHQQIPAEVHLDAEHALSLMDRFGYGLAPRRYRNRNE